MSSSYSIVVWVKLFMELYFMRDHKRYLQGGGLVFDINLANNQHLLLFTFIFCYTFLFVSSKGVC